MDTMYPKYDESIVSLASSILKYYGIDNPGHTTLPYLDTLLAERKPRNVVLMLFDGFGYNIMQRNLPDDSFLRRHTVMSLSSTFPPTTAAATTALLSAKTPIENGWLGWFSYFKDIDEIVTTFTSLRQRDGVYVGQNMARKYMPYTSIGTMISQSNPNVRYTELTPFAKSKTDSLGKLESMLSRTLNGTGDNFVYCYWPDPDWSMHEYGVQDPRSIDCERKIDSYVEKLTSKFKDTIFMVVADHGLIDSKYIYLSDYPKLFSLMKRPFSMEGRAATFFIKESCLKEFRSEFERCCGEHFILMDRKELFESGLLGTGVPHPMVTELVGDYIAIAKDSYSLATERSEGELIGVHAGLTQDEMLVPLVVVDRT